MMIKTQDTMFNVLSDLLGVEVMLFTTGQVGLPSGGQVDGVIDTLGKEYVQLLQVDGTSVFVSLAHLVRVTVRAAK